MPDKEIQIEQDEQDLKNKARLLYLNAFQKALKNHPSLQPAQVQPMPLPVQPADNMALPEGSTNKDILKLLFGA